MRFFLWRADVEVILLTTTLLASLSHAQEPRVSQRDSVLLADSSVRAAVARIAADSTRGQVHVDVEPMPSEFDTLGRGFIPTSSGMRSRIGFDRLGDVERVALRSTSDAIRDSCGGRMVPYSPETVHKGCPKDPELIVVLGRAWAVNGSRLDSLSASSARTHTATVLRSVRVIETQVSRYGRTTTVYDYLVGLDRDQWFLVQKVPLLILE
jgi:hypothetical protein